MNIQLTLFKATAFIQRARIYMEADLLRIIGMLALASILSNTAFGEGALAPKLEADCDKNQMALNTCAGIAFHKADSELNRLYQEQMAYLKSENFKKALQESQRAWISFRDKDCFYQIGPEDQRGSLDDYIESACMYIHTKRRIEDLKKYISCRENGCPY